MSVFRDARKHITTHWVEWVNEERDKKEKKQRAAIAQFRADDRDWQATADLVYNNIKRYVSEHMDDWEINTTWQEATLPIPATVWPEDTDGKHERRWGAGRDVKVGIPDLVSARARVRALFATDDVELVKEDTQFEWGKPFTLVMDHYYDEIVTPEPRQ